MATVQAAAYGAEIGLASSDLIGAILLIQFLGVPAAFAYGALAGRIGTKNGIYLALVGGPRRLGHGQPERFRREYRLVSGRADHGLVTRARSSAPSCGTIQSTSSPERSRAASEVCAVAASFSTAWRRAWTWMPSPPA